jgi:hypothetical protein
MEICWLKNLYYRANSSKVGSKQIRARGWSSPKRPYSLRCAGNNPELILIASGSELNLAVEAHEELIADGIRSRVVSMPCWDIFEHQPRTRVTTASKARWRGSSGVVVLEKDRHPWSIPTSASKSSDLLQGLFQKVPAVLPANTLVKE